MRQISRCVRYEKMLSSTLSGSFSMVCNREGENVCYYIETNVRKYHAR